MDVANLPVLRKGQVSQGVGLVGLGSSVWRLCGGMQLVWNRQNVFETSSELRTKNIQHPKSVHIDEVRVASTHH